MSQGCFEAQLSLKETKEEVEENARDDGRRNSNMPLPLPAAEKVWKESVL